MDELPNFDLPSQTEENDEVGDVFSQYGMEISANDDLQLKNEFSDLAPEDGKWIVLIILTITSEIYFGIPWFLFICDLRSSKRWLAIQYVWINITCTFLKKICSVIFWAVTVL